MRRALLLMLDDGWPGVRHGRAPSASRAVAGMGGAPEPGACVDGIVAAERREGTLPGLLSAIARAESGRPVPPLPGLQPWPWAINADGAAYYFDSKPAAVAWTRLALDRGVRQIDVGCMQINLQSHPRAFASLDQAFDPAANAGYAATFLGSAAGGRRGQLVCGDRVVSLADAGVGGELPRAGGGDRGGSDPCGEPWGAAVYAGDPAGDAADRAAWGRGVPDQRGAPAVGAGAGAAERVPDCGGAGGLHVATGARRLRGESCGGRLAGGWPCRVKSATVSYRLA